MIAGMEWTVETRPHGAPGLGYVPWPMTIIEKKRHNADGDRLRRFFAVTMLTGDINGLLVAATYNSLDELFGQGGPAVRPYRRPCLGVEWLAARGAVSTPGG
jgi:hypothetical protein